MEVPRASPHGTREGRMSFCLLHNANRCDVQVAPAFLMCKGHWAMVPANIQNRVYSTWRTYKRMPTSRLARTAYNNARVDAGDAVMRALHADGAPRREAWEL